LLRTFAFEVDGRAAICGLERIRRVATFEALGRRRSFVLARVRSNSVRKGANRSETL
jgi:hypothetical protein